MLSSLRWIAPAAAVALALTAQPAAAVVATNSAAPAISGTATAGNTLGCTSGTWDVTPLTGSITEYRYAWLRGATDVTLAMTPIAGASGSSYTLTEADVGSYVACRVTPYDGLLPNAVTADSAAKGPVASAQSGGGGGGQPASLVPPTTSPLLAIQPGQTATCNAGVWQNAVGLARSYEWARNGTKIANGQTYLVVSGDAGSALTCTEKVGSASSAPSAPLIVAGLPDEIPELAAPSNVTLPTIDGTPQSGRTVTCNPGLWLPEPTSYTYQWKRDTTAVGAAQTYALTDADVARQVTCTVVASNSKGSSAPKSSLPIIPLGAGVALPFNQSPPTISGTPKAGQTLTCAPGVWIPGNEIYSYQWNANGGPLGGATQTAYTVATPDVGKKLTCTVTAENDIGKSRATSESVTVLPADGSIAPPVNTSAPALSGSAVVGRTLSCTQGSWSGNPTEYHYRWARAGKLISGAMQSSYKLQPADARNDVACAVIATNSGGHGAAASQAVQVIAESVGADTVKPRITNFRASPKKFRLQKGKTTFRWRLSEAATVKLRLARKVVKRDGTIKWKRVGSLTKRAKKGANKAVFKGKVGKRLVKAGRYRVWITATDAAGNFSKQRRASLKLKPALKTKARL